MVNSAFVVHYRRKASRPGERHPKRRLLIACLAATILAGCGSKEPRDLSLASDLAPPPPEELRVAASEIDHPILKPLAFDDRDGISPDEAAILAVLSNPSLRFVRSRRGIAGAQVIQAGILPNPELAYAMGLPIGERSDATPIPYGFGVGWEVTSLLTWSARKEAAEAQAGAVDLEVAWQEWQVSQAAKMHLVRLLFIQEEIAAAGAVEESLRSNLEVTRRALDLGSTSSFDLAAAESAHFDASSRRLKLEEEEQTERSLLDRALGLPPESVVKLQEGSTPEITPPPPASKALEGIEESRLDLLALRKGYESQEAKLRAAVRGSFPKVRLGVLMQRDTNSVQTVGFGVSVELPFFDRNQGAIALEEATCDALFEEYRMRLFEARHQVAQIVSQMESLGKRLALESDSLKTLRQRATLLDAALEGGSIASPAYYDARTSLALKEIEVLEIRRTLTELRIGLELATGRVGAPAPSASEGD